MARRHREPASHERETALGLLNEIGARRMFTAQRLARRGRLHPDPEVAGFTVQWAHAVLSVEAKYPKEAASLPRFFRAMLIEIATLGLWGDFRYQSALLERKSRRVAQQILHTAEATGTDHPNP